MFFLSVKIFPTITSQRPLSGISEVPCASYRQHAEKKKDSEPRRRRGAQELG